ncbi:hypothetical protein EOD42_14045 [Rhodovarius crocodyli]|uniref:Uncharacterized protein n=1 Tax=Rhodovarius crocodyli TaxID=1979269 RepID=A0A437MEZ0_9PROT|nr:hypothetical protein [Rhodovarius crocodyli]RVT96231.1 hypothetical protein EOD42_14045 [Rhodovarius crocodyli]
MLNFSAEEIAGIEAAITAYREGPERDAAMTNAYRQVEAAGRRWNSGEPIVPPEGCTPLAKACFAAVDALAKREAMEKAVKAGEATVDETRAARRLKPLGAALSKMAPAASADVAPAHPKVAQQPNHQKAIAALPLAQRAHAEQLAKAGQEEELQKFLGLARVALPPIVRAGTRVATNLLRASATVAPGAAAKPTGLASAAKKVSGWTAWRSKQPSAKSAGVMGAKPRAPSLGVAAQPATQK